MVGSSNTFAPGLQSVFVVKTNHLLASAATTVIKIDELTPEHSLFFYPNPADDRISLNYNTANTSLVQIRNTMGQLVFEKIFTGQIHEYVHTNNLANGTYFISLLEKDQTITKKLIVSK